MDIAINKYTFFNPETKQTIYLDKETGLVKYRKNPDNTIDVFVNGKFVCANKHKQTTKDKEMSAICDGMVIDLYGAKFILKRI
jgi:hypothetical protein